MQSVLSLSTTRRPDLILIWSSVAAAWIVTILLVAIGSGDYIVDHDAVLENRQFGWAPTLLLFIAAWQLMTAAMMLPSSMPMMAMFLRVSQSHDRPLRSFGTFMLGYFAIWTGFDVKSLAVTIPHHLFQAWRTSREDHQSLAFLSAIRSRAARYTCGLERRFPEGERLVVDQCPSYLIVRSARLWP